MSPRLARPPASAQSSARLWVAGKGRRSERPLARQSERPVCSAREAKSFDSIVASNSRFARPPTQASSERPTGRVGDGATGRQEVSSLLVPASPRLPFSPSLRSSYHAPHRLRLSRLLRRRDDGHHSLNQS